MDMPLIVLGFWICLFLFSIESNATWYAKIGCFSCLKYV